MDQPGALRALSKEYVVKGSGETLEAALQAGFKAMRAAAFKEAGQPVVFMEPEDVVVLKAEVAKWTERFLFVFWPRERRKYTLELKIKVQMKTVDFSTVDMREVPPGPTL